MAERPWGSTPLCDSLGGDPEDRICVALDRASEEDNVALVRSLSGRARWYKVGLGQYCAGAERLIGEIGDAGARLFLDLKLHDIPATVEHAARSIARHRPALATVHASGGGAMVRAAVAGLTAGGAEGCGVLGVTVLTSLSGRDLAEIGLEGEPDVAVTRLAALALEAGARGVVSSALEVRALRERFPEAVLVTPGIRGAGDAAGDQKRTLGAKEAIAAGSSLLVVGRPVARAEDPRVAFDAIAAAVARGA